MASVDVRETLRTWWPWKAYNPDLPAGQRRSA